MVHSNMKSTFSDIYDSCDQLEVKTYACAACMQVFASNGVEGLAVAVLRLYWLFAWYGTTLPMSVHLTYLQKILARFISQRNLCYYGNVCNVNGSEAFA